MIYKINDFHSLSETCKSISVLIFDTLQTESACVEGSRSLYSQISTGETRNVRHRGISLMSLRKLRVGGAINSLVTFAICRARPGPNPLEWLFQTLPLKTCSLVPSYFCILYGLLTSMLASSEITPDPRPLSCRTHLHSHMYFAEFCVVTYQALLCTWNWNNYCLETFFQILLCLSMLTINLLGLDFLQV